MDKTETYQTFGNLIRSLRENKSKLLRQAAADLEVDQAILSKLENGLILPTDDLIEKLSSYYRISADELRVHAYAQKIVGTVGEFKYAEKALLLAKEQLSSYEVKRKVTKTKQRGSK